MATPGRTHIPWQTQTGQVQELISYIGFLEAKVQYLQKYHEQCDPWNSGVMTMDLDPVYLPPDYILASIEPSIPPDSSLPMDILSSVESSVSPDPPPHAEFIYPFNDIPPAVQVSPKVPGTNPRWKKIIDLMVKDWNTPQSWTTKRSALGLNTVESNNSALTIILGLSKSLPPNPFQHPISQSTKDIQSTTSTSTNEALIQSARQYAIDTKATSASAGLLVQIHTFRELVFASLCVVMEAHGLKIETINDLMRICMSSSGAANLYRLRRGALWVNRVIRGLMKKGWGFGATEFFLLSGKPVSQYGLLWEACAHSFPYLTEKLESVKEFVIIPPQEPGRIPFFIPLIIKELVGDSLTLKEIWTALDYEEGLMGDMRCF